MSEEPEVADRIGLVVQVSERTVCIQRSTGVSSSQAVGDANLGLADPQNASAVASIPPSFDAHLLAHQSGVAATTEASE